jgi:hypothetical protein
VLFANRNQHRSLLLRLQSYQKHRGFQKGPIGFSARRFSAPLKILELEEKKAVQTGNKVSLDGCYLSVYLEYQSNKAHTELCLVSVKDL